MHSYIRFLLIGLLSVGLLTACGGGDDPPITKRDSDSSGDNGGGSGGGGSGGGGGGGGSVSGSGISYVPLAVFEAYKDFSGATQDNVFKGDGEFPLIKRYAITPIDAATLLPTASAAASDYRVTISGIEIDASESFPILQRVMGLEMSLRTALVFDLSNSANHVDIDALVAEAKAYVAATRASSNAVINSQEFVVWAFGTTVLQLTDDFTFDINDINEALDEVAVRFNNQSLGGASNLNQAIVETIGGFDATENGVSYNFRDGVGEDNDLDDYVYADGIWLNHLVVFSSGPDTGLAFSAETMAKAVEAQSLLKYDQSTSGAMRKQMKPVFYYVLGRDSPGVTYTALSALSERTSSLRLSGGNYSFASSLITNQLAAINARVDLNNFYMYRYAFLPRAGDHTAAFSSTNATGFSYTITTDYDNDAINTVPDIFPVTEITGANGEYISNGTLTVSGSITLRPVTRWTSTQFGSGDYSWTVMGGTMTGTVNGDGSYTVTSVTGSATLRLENTVIGGVFDLELTN